MLFQHSLAWLFWDPPIVAFTIPYLNHPVVWYGILFVTGFVLGYFIVNPLFVRFLKENPHLSSVDVLDWNKLLANLFNNNSPLADQILKNIPPSLRQQISPASLPGAEVKQAVLDSCNQLLDSGGCSRDQLQELFGNTLSTLKQTAYFLTDRLCWFAVAGTVIGARLGAVIFYDWPLYANNPIEIFKVWHGGLASHGGVLGVIAALYLYVKYVQRWVPQLTLLKLLDIVAIPGALAGCFIRLGNFMNQEILGTPTSMPWGIIFGHPVDGSIPEPRHPVQLYEAAAYLLIFVVLWRIWKKQASHFYQPGQIVGWLFLLLFGCRFLIEFFKATQTSVLDSSWIQMGQLLSIPFILLGIALILYSRGFLHKSPQRQ
jgi:prolipoprotein diacylglyceryl transferase